MYASFFTSTIFSGTYGCGLGENKGSVVCEVQSYLRKLLKFLP